MSYAITASSANHPVQVVGGSQTLTAQDRHGVLTGKRIRRLMPVECERLQGFPDAWTKYGNDKEISNNQRYKCCGNAVTVNVIAAIFNALQS